jgi:hypothetical protein
MQKLTMCIIIIIYYLVILETRTYYVTQTGIKLMVLLHQPLEFKDYRLAPPPPAMSYIIYSCVQVHQKYNIEQRVVVIKEP